MNSVELHARLYARGLGRSTVNDYIAAIYTVDRWCRDRGWTLSTVPGPVLADFVADLPSSWASRKRYRSALTHYWHITRRRHPPLGVLTAPRKPRGQCRALDEDDARLVYKTAQEWRESPAGLAVLFMLCMALRRFEVAKIRTADFNDGWLTVVGKGGSVDDLPVPPQLEPQLARWWHAGRWLFPGRQPGRPVCPMTVTTWSAHISDAAGVAFTPHRLRHTALATLNDDTGDLRATMEFARHKNPETTLIYTRTKRSRLEAMAGSLTYDS
jgi:integrase/recombinase XerC